MADDEQILRWVEAYKETQRQMSQAHEAYQKALADSHQKYLLAVGQSQNRLLHVLEQVGIRPDQLEAQLETPPLDAHHLPEENTQELAAPNTDRTREFSGRTMVEESNIDRVVPTVFSVPQSGKPFSPLISGARVAILPDSLGIAEHVADMLRTRGLQTQILTASDAPIAADVLIVMLGLQKEPSAIQGPLRQALAVIPDDPEMSVVIVQDMGGKFGTDFLEPAHAYQAAMQGLSDVLRLNPARLVKTVDLDVGFRKLEDPAHDLVRELLMGADDLRVGLPEGNRVLWSAIARAATPQLPDVDAKLLLLTVSDARWRPLVEAIVAAFGGEVVLLSNEAIGDIERISCDLSDIDALTSAIDVARQKGPITHWIHLPVFETVGCSVAEFESLWDQNVRPFQVVLANTSSDPLMHIGVAVGGVHQLGYVTASVFRALCVAESRRREGETRVVAVSFEDDFNAPYLCSELLTGGEAPDVRYVQ